MLHSYIWLWHHDLHLLHVSSQSWILLELLLSITWSRDLRTCDLYRPNDAQLHESATRSIKSSTSLVKMIVKRTSQGRFSACWNRPSQRSKPSWSTLVVSFNNRLFLGKAWFPWTALHLSEKSVRCTSNSKVLDIVSCSEAMELMFSTCTAIGKESEDPIRHSCQPCPTWLVDWIKLPRRIFTDRNWNKASAFCWQH